MKLKIFLLTAGFIAFLLSCSVPVPVQNSVPASNKSELYTNGVYVSPNGNDTNSGVKKDALVLSIRLAIEKMISNSKDYICLADGNYIPGSGLNVSNIGIYISNDNIDIIGGFNSDFSAIVSKSVLNGTNSLENIVCLSNSTNITLKNLVIINGMGDSIGGGGIKMYNTSFSYITNCMLSNNESFNGLKEGGGVFIHGGEANVISALFYDNHAKYGGGIYIDTSKNNLLNVEMYNNSDNSTSGRGGGIYFYYVTNNTLNGVIAENSATTYGGGLYAIFSANNLVNVTFSKNSSYRGGAVFLENCNNNTITGIVISNSCWFGGGGISVKNGSANTFSCDIISNTSQDGAGIYLWETSCNIIKGVVYDNNASRAGGGVYIKNGTNNMLRDLIITNNSASATNASIYMDTTNGISVYMISNCLIGGAQTAATGIYEGGGDLSNHILLDNKFIAASLDYLYYDYKNSAYISNISDLNDTNKTGAMIASGNVTQ